MNVTNRGEYYQINGLSYVDLKNIKEAMETMDGLQMTVGKNARFSDDIKTIEEWL